MYRITLIHSNADFLENQFPLNVLHALNKTFTVTWIFRVVKSIYIYITGAGFLFFATPKFTFVWIQLQCTYLKFISFSYNLFINVSNLQNNTKCKTLNWHIVKTNLIILTGLKYIIENLLSINYRFPERNE